MAGPGRGRRSFLVDALSGVAGLWVTATGVALAGCVPVTKYGGPPPPPVDLEPVAKYGGPPEPGPDRFAQPPDAPDADGVAVPTKEPGPPEPLPSPPVAKYGGPPPPVMVMKYGGPPDRLPSPPKYGGPPRL